MGYADTLGNSFESRQKDQESHSSQINEGKVEQSTFSVVGGLGDDQIPLQVPKGSIGYSRQVDVV